MEEEEEDGVFKGGAVGGGGGRINTANALLHRTKRARSATGLWRRSDRSSKLPRFRQRCDRYETRSQSKQEGGEGCSGRARQGSTA